MRYNAETVEERNASEGKPLRGRQHIRDGQFQDKIGAAHNGRRRSSMFREHGKITALDKVAAHNADNGALFSQHAASLCNMEGMGKMKRIIFADNSCNFHFFTPRM
jgi:hypothetical protein